MFKNLSIPRRLYLLGFVLCTCMLVIGLASYIGFNKVGGQLHDVTEVQLPAIRNMTLADMMHDGIRASVYSVIVHSNLKQAKEAKAAGDEFEEMAGNITKYLNVIDALNVRVETKTAISSARPEVDRYVKSGRAIVSKALDGDMTAVNEMIPGFQASFEDLEGKLEKLGELIEKDANQSEASGDSSKIFTLSLTLFFFVFGSLLCFVVVRSVISQLNLQIAKVVEEARALSGVISDLNSASTTLTTSSTKQVDALTVTSSAITEILSMVKKNTESSVRSSEAAERGNQSANSSLESIHEMSHAINEILESNTNVGSQITEINKQMSSLSGVITEIGHKTKVINDIVFQTKLLSFNASVEAARAGEQGKGFAVVAQEIGNLAQMSGTAAHDIYHMLDESIKRVNEATEETRTRLERIMKDAGQKVEAGTRITGRCGADLQQLLDQIQEVTSLNKDISVASKEQEVGVSSINTSVLQLNELNSENARAAQQTAAAAEQIGDRYTALNEVVESFEVLFGRKAS